jgi:hypothetical protein
MFIPEILLKMIGLGPRDFSRGWALELRGNSGDGPKPKKPFQIWLQIREDIRDF